MNLLPTRRLGRRAAVSVALAIALVAGIPLAAGALGSMTWAKSSAYGPGERYWSSMAYDEQNQELVLFGGVNGGDFETNSTSTWNGSGWTSESPEVAPSPRFGTSMAFDQNTDTMILFGGANTDLLSDETWSWDGSNWTQLGPVHHPSARVWSGLATEPSTGDLILFGGFTDAGDSNETWRWDGTDWTLLTPQYAPSPRDGFLMVPDAPHNNIVVFGGNEEFGQAGDTWTWDGTTWSRRVQFGPQPRSDMQFTFDARLNRPLLFGGYWETESDFGALQDTWAWTGQEWTPLTPTGKPSPRDSGSMAYFPPSGTAVLFGGFDEDVEQNWVLNDTWTLNLATGTAAPALSTTASAANTLKVSWNAPGAPTGYVVQYAQRVKNSYGNVVTSAFVNWKTFAGTTHSATFSGTGGSTYLFRVKAVYAGGAATTFSPAVTSVIPYDERNAINVFSSGWSSLSATNRFAGTLRSTTLVGKTMSVKATLAHSFVVIGDKCPKCGKMKVYIDGALVKTIDTYRSSTAPRQVLFTKTFNGTYPHSLKIVNLATAGRPKLTIDAVAIQR